MRCALCEAKRLERGTLDINPLSGRLVDNRTVAQYRKATADGIAKALREMHAARRTRSASDPVARYPGEPTYRR
jgi:hypothetical protein